MTNKYFAPGEQRADRVKDLFAAIAPLYDLINDLQRFGLHRGWKRRVVRLACEPPGPDVLDVCCGTGDLAFALAQRGRRAVGLDFSGPMLAVAERRLRRHRSRTAGRPVRFLRGDALRLPFRDGSFDAVTVGYGLRNLADWQGGLQEMGRVLRPGGRLLVLDFGKPDNAVWRGLYFAYLRQFVPRLGRLFTGDDALHGYILESLIHYPAQNGVAAAMTAMNLAGVRIINLLGGIMTINLGERR